MSNNNYKFDALRKRAEQLLSSIPKTNEQDKVSDISLNLDELIHELEVHQMELEMQHVELQESHRRLEENRQQYVDLFDFAPIGYIVTDEKGFILNVNLTLTAMFAMNRTEIEGRSLAKFINKADVDIYYLNRQSVFQTGQTQTCEVRVQIPGAQSFYARLDSSLIDGKNQCRVALTDISHQKQAELSTKQALEKSKQLNELKTRLLDMITHEFRTPLSIILTSVDTLEKYDTRLDEQSKKRRHQKIRDYVWHITRMVNEVAGAYRAESDNVRVKRTEFDCKSIMTELISDLEDIYPDRLEFIVAQTDDSDHTVEFDEALLRQIIMNLVDNGIKYSDASVIVNLDIQDANFTITIRDQGIGIPADELEHVFDTFYRGKRTETVAGTGIGLSIVKRLVDICHGEISIHSIVDSGTSITLIFPRHPGLN